MSEDALYAVEIRYDVRIPVRDGLQLSANLFMPVARGANERFPAILEMLPYRKDDWRHCSDHQRMTYFAQRGYAGSRGPPSWSLDLIRSGGRVDPWLVRSSTPTQASTAPGSFTTETKDELMKHVELLAKEAHPGLQMEPEQIEALVKTTDYCGLSKRLTGNPDSLSAARRASGEPFLEQRPPTSSGATL